MSGGSDHLTLEPPAVDAVLESLPSSGDVNTDRPEVMWARHDGRSVVVKHGTGRSRAALRREGEVLARVQMPGVVELVEVIERDPITALVLADAGHRTLRDPDGISPEVLLRSLRHTARVVASLHGRGWFHGDLDPEHVIVGPRGRVRLCSLASAGTVTAPEDARGDVARLVELVGYAAEELDAASSRRGSRRVRTLHQELRSKERLDAGAIADELDRLCRGEPARGRRARLVRPSFSARPTRRGALTLLMVAGAAVAIAPTSRGDDPGRDATPLTVSGDATTTTPTTDVAPASPPAEPSPTGPTVTLGGVTYRVGLDGDVAVTGAFGCDGEVGLRVLRPSTGEIFGFDEVPRPGERISGRVLDVVPGATGLAVRPATGSDRGCDRLVARTAAGDEREVT